MTAPFTQGSLGRSLFHLRASSLFLLQTRCATWLSVRTRRTKVSFPRGRASLSLPRRGRGTNRKVGGRSKEISLSLAYARQLPQRGSLVKPRKGRDYKFPCRPRAVQPIPSARSVRDMPPGANPARHGCRPSPTANWVSVRTDQNSSQSFACGKIQLSQGESLYSLALWERWRR